MKFTKFLFLVVLSPIATIAQPPVVTNSDYYNVGPQNGYGLRFWGNDLYKISMAWAADYHYGPVTGYSIKMNMNSDPGNGWTWGKAGEVPIAALDNTGNMQIAGVITSGSSTVWGKDANFVGSDMFIGRNSSAAGIGRSPSIQFQDNGSGARAMLQAGSAGVQLFTTTASSWSEIFRITLDGRMGLGTTSPGSFKLAVEGKIGAREVNVTTVDPWPDYVFFDTYKLPSLESVKKFISVNHHLPEIPSAKDVEANGINVGEMNALLLKKIEELTLYVIDQQKQIEELRTSIKK